MNNKVKSRLLCVVALVFGACSAASVAGSRFDEATAFLEIPCFALVPDEAGATPATAPTYTATMVLEGQNLRLYSARQIARPSACTGVYDSVTKEFTDEVRIRDELFAVSLHLQPNGEFRIGGTEYRGLAPSSLWRVTDGVNEIFIGGTIHVLRESDYPLPPGFLAAYAASHILVTETTRADYLDIAPHRLAMLDPDWVVLNSRLRPATYTALSNYLRSRGLNIGNVNPLLGTNFLVDGLYQLEMKMLGFGMGVDEFFMNLAFSESRLNLGLETSASVVTVINQANAGKSHDDLILDTLDNIASGQFANDLIADVRSWREGDMDLIWEGFAGWKQANPADYAAMLTDRNAAWIPLIVSFFSTAEVEFVIAGAAHMAGPDSVLEMLRQLGYQVSRY